jgi:D-alanyl-D-alanine carboxypeptidase
MEFSYYKSAIFNIVAFMNFHKFNLNKHSTLITISKRASLEVGTTANLQEGDILSLWDLLHALMLPSGNDAAIALAEYFGDYLLSQENSKPAVCFFNHRMMSTTSKELKSF